MATRADFVASRREKRRQQIFNGAVKVFADKGYHSATTQEIAEAAGLAKGTLYEYVRDKEEILLLVIEESTRILTREIQTINTRIQDPVERLDHAIQAQLKFTRKYCDAAKVMRRQVSVLSPTGKTRCSELVDIMIESFRSVIDYGIRRGCFKELDSRMAAEMLIHVCTISFDYGELPCQKASFKKISSFIIDNFAHALIRPDAQPRGAAS